MNLVALRGEIAETYVVLLLEEARFFSAAEGILTHPRIPMLDTVMIAAATPRESLKIADFDQLEVIEASGFGTIEYANIESNRCRFQILLSDGEWHFPQTRIYPKASPRWFSSRGSNRAGRGKTLLLSSRLRNFETALEPWNQFLI